MGCGGSKTNEAVEQLSIVQKEAIKKQEQMAAQQQKQLEMQAKALEHQQQQQKITMQQFEEQKGMLAAQQQQLVQQQQEALQMALLAKQQAENAANAAAEQALKKAEAMKRRITPPPKPGKVNIIVQTDRTIPPMAIMKRRKKRDEFGNEIPANHGDHREECGGVGSDAVEAPMINQVPVMVAIPKTKAEGEEEVEDGEDEYEYQYEYQYQYTTEAAEGMVGPSAVVKAAGETIKQAEPMIAPIPIVVKKESTEASEPVEASPDGGHNADEEYEYEYEED